MKRGLLLEVVAETIPAGRGVSQGANRTGPERELPKPDASEPKAARRM
jgi:hypothetical protein